MKSASLFKPALVALSLAGVLAGCQTAPSANPLHPDPAGDMRHKEGKHRMHRFHKGDGPRIQDSWRNPEVRAQLQQACNGKAAGQLVTINLQNGKTLQGSCELRFKPDLPDAGNRP